MYIFYFIIYLKIINTMNNLIDYVLKYTLKNCIPFSTLTTVYNFLVV